MPAKNKRTHRKVVACTCRVDNYGWIRERRLYNLPYARVLSDEDAQKLDAARIGAAIRLAILLLASSSSGALLHDGEASLSVTADDSGVSYSFVDSDGEVVDSGEEWEPLIARLGTDLPAAADDFQIIWP